MRETVYITATPRGNFLYFKRAATETPRVLDKNLRRGMHTANQKVIGKTVRARFTGKGPFPSSQNKLGVRTGLLRRSIRSSYPQGEMGEITSKMGSHVKYFGGNEFGFQGVVKVAAASVKNTTINNAFGKTSFSILAHTRRAHLRSMNVPARAPLATGIEENQEIYQKQFDADVAKTLAEII